MKPEYVLILGSLGLGLTLAHALWCEARVVVFKADLLKIRARLDATMRAKGSTGDAYDSLVRGLLDTLLSNATYLSYPAIHLFTWASRPEVNSAKAPTMPAPRRAPSLTQDSGSDGTLSPEAGRALIHAGIVLLIHILTSPAGLLDVILILVSVGREGLAERLASLKFDGGFDGLVKPFRHRGDPVSVKTASG